MAPPSTQAQPPVESYHTQHAPLVFFVELHEIQNH